MALLPDDNAQLCMKSELELFTSPNVQVAVEDGFWTEYHPLATLTDQSPIEFAVTGNQDALLDLSQSYLHIRVKITKENGTAIDDADKVGPVNLFLHSLFR